MQVEDTKIIKFLKAFTEDILEKKSGKLFEIKMEDEDIENVQLKPMKLKQWGTIKTIIDNNKDEFKKFFDFSENEEEGQEINEEFFNDIYQLVVNQYPNVLEIIFTATKVNMSQEEFEDNYDIEDLVNILLCVVKVNIDFFMSKVPSVRELIGTKR
ncbi:hypothetical protein ACKXGF_07520 [Alkalibacillus sp. S2W]|uniref:hypothetical protein n=1 Tax=Alkalibacillus sp. S2W TaxID=3386553 RepID=UPI00398D29EA